MKIYCTTPGCGYSEDSYDEQSQFPIWKYECPKCLRREFSAVQPTDQSDLDRLRKENAALREALQGLYDAYIKLKGYYPLPFNKDRSVMDAARAALQGAKE